MVPFAGYQMPLKYSSIKNEHHAVRYNAGLFDVSHMGEILIEGKDSSRFVQYLLTNNTKKMDIGQAQYNLICNPSGTLVDDAILYKLSTQKYLLVVNATNIIKDLSHIKSLQSNAIDTESFDVKITNISDEICLLALQGPKSLDI
jgi:aminomethyltransferase